MPSIMRPRVRWKQKDTELNSLRFFVHEVEILELQKCTNQVFRGWSVWLGRGKLLGEKLTHCLDLAYLRFWRRGSFLKRKKKIQFCLVYYCNYINVRTCKRQNGITTSCSHHRAVCITLDLTIVSLAAGT